MKQLLFAAYVVSVLYCYMNINLMIDKCIEIFKERHPTIPVENGSFDKGLKVWLEILCISAIPVLNVFLGYVFSTMDSEIQSDIIDSVELTHRVEIMEAERLAGKLNDLDKYF